MIDDAVKIHPGNIEIWKFKAIEQGRKVAKITAAQSSQRSK
jgi:hypothetical protein